jgi:predicted CoA-binding protein
MSVPPHVQELLASRDGSTRIALVGATNHAWKYGSIIFNDLAQRGFTVLPINPSAGAVHGVPAYASVAEAPGPVHIVNFVVPPEVAIDVVRLLDPAVCDVVWFQPGASDAVVVREAERKFSTVIAGDCIMVVARWARSV